MSYQKIDDATPNEPQQKLPAASTAAEQPRIIRKLTPWNPLDQFRLLWWLFIRPNLLELYRQQDDNGLRRTGTWLSATIAWLCPFLIALAASLNLVLLRLPLHIPWILWLLLFSVLWLLTVLAGYRKQGQRIGAFGFGVLGAMIGPAILATYITFGAPFDTRFLYDGSEFFAIYVMVMITMFTATATAVPIVALDGGIRRSVDLAAFLVTCATSLFFLMTLVYESYTGIDGGMLTESPLSFLFFTGPAAVIIALLMVGGIEWNFKIHKASFLSHLNYWIYLFVYGVFLYCYVFGGWHSVAH